MALIGVETYRWLTAYATSTKRSMSYKVEPMCSEQPS